MTTPDIDRIRELEAKATPGPWEVDEENDEVSVRAGDARTLDGYLPGSYTTTNVVLDWDLFGDDETEFSHDRQRRDDAEFIAAARNILPELIAAVDERDKRITELECPHDSWSGDRPSSEPNGRWLCDQCGTDCGPRDALPDPRIAELERQIASVREVLRDADQYLVDDNWLARLLAALGDDL